MIPPLLLPPPPPLASSRFAADSAFMDAVQLIDPHMLSRDKAALLGTTLRLTRAAVYAAARRCGLSLCCALSLDDMELPLRRAEFRDADVADIVSALESGATMADIADYYGVCPKTLQNWMRRAGIASRHDIGRTDDEVFAAIQRLRTCAIGFRNTGVTFTHGACLEGGGGWGSAQPLGSGPARGRPGGAPLDPDPSPSPSAGRLLAEGMRVSRRRVARILAALDPEGAHERWRATLRRREYWVRGGGRF